jgi:hypothetical protein
MATQPQKEENERIKVSIRVLNNPDYDLYI